MKFEYEKPNLEELELVLEGSFLNAGTGSSTGGSSTDVTDPTHPGIGGDDGYGDNFD